MLTITLILSVLFNIVLLYVCFNLYRKIEIYENILVRMNGKINNAVQNMRNIDLRGAFEADDEVGSTFQSLLQIVNELEDIIYGEEEK